MSLRFKLISATAALALSAAPALATEEVKIGVPSWTGAQAIAHLLGAVVETRIGGKVEYVPGNNATIFQAMDQGKGDIDVHPDVWLPNQESFTKEYVDGKGTVTLSSNSYAGNQGFCVSKDFAAANNITDITDLGRPDVAALMDSDGNGKGEMWFVDCSRRDTFPFAPRRPSKPHASRTQSPRVKAMPFTATSRMRSGTCSTSSCCPSRHMIRQNT